MNKIAIAVSLFTFSLSLFASRFSPPSFQVREGRVVFVDFQDADYVITYDATSEEASVESTINFNSTEEGFPVFDLISSPQELLLDGVKVSSKSIQDPDRQTTLRMINQVVLPGIHELKIKHTITQNVVFNFGAVASGFWMSDLNDRRYLEQYLPTNLEYDQYKMFLRVDVVGGKNAAHTMKANGKVSQIDENSFEITYPDFYTASSVFFHLFPTSTLTNNVQFYYPSIDGRLIPVDIYTSYNVGEFEAATKRIIGELEQDYGPFPHDQVVIYGNAPSGGMEYCGATATSLSALGHELFHSYHARGLIPANGNAGWMDEAIARWRDNNYPLNATLNIGQTRLAGHSQWARLTDRMAYKEGSAFLSWIAYRMSEIGLSFKSFLRDYFQKYKYQTVTTQLFQSELTQASTLDLSGDFDRHIYGVGAIQSPNKSVPHQDHDAYHPRYSEKELQDMTWPQ